MASGRFLVSWGGLDGNLIAAANFNQEWFQARHLQMWQKKNTNRQKGGLDWHLIAAANWPTLTRKLRHGCESGIFWCEERKNINRQTSEKFQQPIENQSFDRLRTRKAFVYWSLKFVSWTLTLKLLKLNNRTTLWQ